MSKKKPRGKSAGKKKDEKPSARAGHLVWLRALAGPAFVVGGWQLQPVSYWVGVAIIYLGFLLCLLEFVYEPMLLSSPYTLQIGLISTVFVLSGWFSIAVVFVQSPIEFFAYSIANSDYPMGTNIGKIPWNSHFTDLRVSITNPSNDDYSDVDLAIQPDQWNYKADVVTENAECKVISIGGNAVLMVSSSKGGARKVIMHHIGSGFEAEDDAGDVFERFIQEGGYRLVCSKLPAHFTVEVAFALVRQGQEMRGLMPKTSQKGQKSMTVAEFKPIDKFDMLDPRPPTYNVIADGHYNHDFKKCGVKAEVHVDGGHQ